MQGHTAMRIVVGLVRLIGWLIGLPVVLLIGLAGLMAADTALRQTNIWFAHSGDWIILLYICSMALFLPQTLLLRLFRARHFAVYLVTGALSMWLAMFGYVCFMDYGAMNGYFVNSDTNIVKIFDAYILKNIPLIGRSATFIVRAPLHGFAIFIVPALFGMFLGSQYWRMCVAEKKVDKL